MSKFHERYWQAYMKLLNEVLNNEVVFGPKNSFYTYFSKKIQKFEKINSAEIIHHWLFHKQWNQIGLMHWAMKPSFKVLAKPANMNNQCSLWAAVAVTQAIAGLMYMALSSVTSSILSV